MSSMRDDQFSFRPCALIIRPLRRLYSSEEANIQKVNTADGGTRLADFPVCIELVLCPAISGSDMLHCVDNVGKFRNFFAFFIT